MTYNECPQCGDTHAVEYDDDTYQCRSCQTPLISGWLTDNWTLHETWEQAP